MSRERKKFPLSWSMIRHPDYFGSGFVPASRAGVRVGGGQHPTRFSRSPNNISPAHPKKKRPTSWRPETITLILSVLTDNLFVKQLFLINCYAFLFFFFEEWDTVGLLFDKRPNDNPR